MITQRPPSRYIVLFLVCVFGLTMACTTTSPPTVPEQIASFPDPKVVDFADVTDEILQQEAERSTAEGVLVIRYPEAEFERLYGDIRPLEEQDWWQERAEGVSVEEYQESLVDRNKTFLAVVRDADHVYVNRGCWSVSLEEICLPMAEPLGCLCFPGQPEEELIPRDPSVACEVAPFLVTDAPACRFRSQCSTDCRAASFFIAGQRFNFEGLFCDCLDEFPFG